MLAAFPRPAAGASSMSPTAAFIPARPTRVADEAAAVESETRKLAAELAPPVRSVTIPVRGLMLLLSAAVVVAVLLSLVQDLLIFLAPEAGFTDRIYRLDLDTEASLPTWLSSCLMLVCSLALLAIGVAVKRESLLKALPWLLLAAAFLLLSLDEAVSLREWRAAGSGARGNSTGISYFAWRRWRWCSAWRACPASCPSSSASRASTARC